MNYEFKQGDQAARIGVDFTVCVVEQLMPDGYFVKWLDDGSYGFLPKTDMEGNFLLVGREEDV